jgi:hypothetical protein
MSSADIEAAKKDVLDCEKSVKDLEHIIEGALNMIYQNHLTEEDAIIQKTIILSAKESIISARQELEWAKQSLDAKEKRLGLCEIRNTQ